jgi:hypothetical protein
LFNYLREEEEDMGLGDFLDIFLNQCVPILMMHQTIKYSLWISALIEQDLIIH